MHALPPKVGDGRPYVHHMCINSIIVRPFTLTMSTQVDRDAAKPVAQGKTDQVPSMGRQRAAVKKEDWRSFACPIQEAERHSPPRSESVRCWRRSGAIGDSTGHRETLQLRWSAWCHGQVHCETPIMNAPIRLTCPRDPCCGDRTRHRFSFIRCP